jgi:hypothetical protein
MARSLRERRSGNLGVAAAQQPVQKACDFPSDPQDISAWAKPNAHEHGYRSRRTIQSMRFGERKRKIL